MNKLNTIILLLLLFLSNNVFSFETSLVKAELESYNNQTKQIVLNGKTYLLKIDAKMSEYSIENLSSKMVKTRELKVGQQYFFSLLRSGNSKSEDFDQVVFISETEPEA